MSPLEINKKIAEIKCMPMFDKCPPFAGGESKNRRAYNWAEYIADAWELMKEMPIGYCVSSTHKGFVCFFWPSDSEQWPSGKGETAPLAICLAWLKWKGVE